KKKLKDKKEKVETKEKIQKEFKSIEEKITEEDIDSVRSELGESSREALIFKFFKYIFSDNTISDENARKFAKEQYDSIFGNGFYELVMKMSTFMQVRDRILAVDKFWDLKVSELVKRIENVELSLEKDVRFSKYFKDLKEKSKIVGDQSVKSLPRNFRINILKAIITKITENALELSKNPPNGLDTELISTEIIYSDLARPIIIAEDIIDYSKHHIENWKESKLNANTSKKGKRVCPFCNNPFEESNLAVASIIGSSDVFNNRILGGVQSGQINICQLCELEHLLRYLSLGKKPPELMILSPTINISSEIGNYILNKIMELKEGIDVNVENFTTQIGFRWIENTSRALLEHFNDIMKFLAKISSQTYLDLIKREVQENDKERNIEKLKKVFENDLIEEDLKEFNEHFGTSFRNWKDLAEAVINGKVRSDYSEVWKDIVEECLKENNIMQIPAYFIYRTPNFILSPLMNPIIRKVPPYYKEEANVNWALRKIFVEILTHFVTDCAVKIISSEKETLIPAEIPKGIA
ncbi:MAG: hypothetical protein ACE5J9_11365, partial [Methanosarcinales archaeon]